MGDDALKGLFAPLYREMAKPLASLCADVLGVPPWVSIDLLRRFIVESSSRIAGQEAWLRTEIEYVPTAAQADYEAIFRIRKGMTSEEAQQALAEFIARVTLETGMASDEESAPSRRKPLPKHEGEALERDARWYYRVMVRGENISGVAGKDGVNRQTVQKAIKRVAPLVEVWTLPPALTNSKNTHRRTPKVRTVRRRTSGR